MTVTVWRRVTVAAHRTPSRVQRSTSAPSHSSAASHSHRTSNSRSRSARHSCQSQSGGESQSPHIVLPLAFSTAPSAPDHSPAASHRHWYTKPKAATAATRRHTAYVGTVSLRHCSCSGCKRCDRVNRSGLQALLMSYRGVQHSTSASHSSAVSRRHRHSLAVSHSYSTS